MILNDQQIATLIQERAMIDPASATKNYVGHLSWGMSSFGYDVRLTDEVVVYKKAYSVDDFSTSVIDPTSNEPMLLKTETKQLSKGFILEPGEFCLGATVETFQLPFDIVGLVRDKSTLARLGLALQNTVLEPGWRGQVTLEISNHGSNRIQLSEGMPIAQIQFLMDQSPQRIYEGRYQDQKGVTLPKGVK